MLIALVSAKGSPGVTTAVLALAASSGAVMVELDPSGGSLECWTGMSGEPGLVRVASGLRRSLETQSFDVGIVEVPPGVSAVLAPTSGPRSESTIAAIGERLTLAMSESERTVILDAGRWGRSQATARRIAGCDAIAIVCRPTVSSIEAARSLVEPLQSATAAPVSLLLVDDRPYSATEVTAATGVRVAGVLARDSRGANALVVSGAHRAWMRSALARSARAALEQLAMPRMTAEEVMS